MLPPMEACSAMIPRTDILIEINPEYAEMAERRIKQKFGLMAEVLVGKRAVAA